MYLQEHECLLRVISSRENSVKRKCQQFKHQTIALGLTKIKIDIVRWQLLIHGCGSTIVRRLSSQCYSDGHHTRLPIGPEGLALRRNGSSFAVRRQRWWSPCLGLVLQQRRIEDWCMKLKIWNWLTRAAERDQHTRKYNYRFGLVRVNRGSIPNFQPETDPNS